MFQQYKSLIVTIGLSVVITVVLGLIWIVKDQAKNNTQLQKDNTVLEVTGGQSKVVIDQQLKVDQAKDKTTSDVIQLTQEAATFTEENKQSTEQAIVKVKQASEEKKQAILPTLTTDQAVSDFKVQEAALVEKQISTVRIQGLWNSYCKFNTCP